jgi:hypothetical protein
MADVKVGDGPAPDITAHVPGISSGNSKGNYETLTGMNPDGTRTARASTGVNTEAREPIDPSMPNLPPA